MKFVFFGTPDYVIPVLEAVAKQHELVAVVTAPPKPVGREKIIVYSAVDTWAHKRNIPVFNDATDPDIPEAKFAVLAAFWNGSYLTDETISMFPLGILNVHPSLLPKYKGASPVQAAIISGESETGVSVIKLSAKVDGGEILSSFKEEILPTDTTETLRNRLFLRSGDFLNDLIEPYKNGKITPKKQDNQNASMSFQVTNQDSFIPTEAFANALAGKESEITANFHFLPDFKGIYNTDLILRALRAFTPWPGIYTRLDIKGEVLRLKILSAHAEDNKLVPNIVQLEGKKPVNWTQFKQGHELALPF